LRTINKYNDWIGWKAAHLTEAQEQKTTLRHDSWNKMLCTAAAAYQFTCVDVYHAFNGPRGAEAAGDLLAADCTHSSDKGNALIADLMKSAGYTPVP